MITIFTLPKPFQGKINIIQRNAIQSWLQIEPACEIILLGDDAGIAEIAKEYNLLHIPEIKKNEFGTPLLSSAFDLAQKKAKNDILMYINADIIAMQNLIPAIRHVNKKDFLICGRRWDLAINEELGFDDKKWASNLMSRIQKHGQLHGPSGLDYFIFPRKVIEMPQFAVGRPGWDTWLMYHMRNQKIPVIDATNAITVIHQDHDYSHSRYGEKKRVGGPEWGKNIELAGGLSCMLTLRDADWELFENDLRKTKFPKRFFSLLSMFYLWRLFLSVKRRLQERFFDD